MFAPSYTSIAASEAGQDGLTTPRQSAESEAKRKFLRQASGSPQHSNLPSQPARESQKPASPLQSHAPRPSGP